MKKNVIRSSMLAVAAMSLLLGGTATPTSVKEQVRGNSVTISKAIANSSSLRTDIKKGTPVDQLAQVSTDSNDNTEVSTVAEVSAQPAEIETKEVKVESDQVVANIDSYLNIRSESNEDSEVVGKFYNGNVGTIVDKGDEWSLVSSGNAYGYVKNDYLLFGSDAEAYIENNCDQVAKVTAETLNIRAEESTDSEVVDLKDEGESLTILGQENGWYKVAVTDEQAGYVSSDFVYVDYVYETAVTVEEEQAAEEARQAEIEAQAQAEAEAAQQQVVNEQTVTESETQQQTVTETPSTEAPATEAPATEAPKKEKKETVESTDIVVKEETTATETVKQESSGTSGQAVADYAVQFVGNPYVYGGTSLTDGADCSGFVQSVYAHFGYSLSRTAASQAGDGTSVSLDNLQPGDLIFYHGFGHVAIYIGGGQVVHASNPSSGIKISSYDYSSIDKAVRIIK